MMYHHLHAMQSYIRKMKLSNNSVRVYSFILKRFFVDDLNTCVTNTFTCKKYIFTNA